MVGVPGENYDQFGDIIGDSSGIFSDGKGAVDDGLKRFDQIVAQVVPEGITVEMSCRSCGRPRQLTVLWPELVALRCNVSPYDAFSRVPQLAAYASRWRVAAVPNGTYWIPEGMRCGKCGADVAPQFDPAECAKIIGEMKRRGWLSQQDEVQVGNVCMQAAARQG